MRHVSPSTTIPTAAQATSHSICTTMHVRPHVAAPPEAGRTTWTVTDDWPEDVPVTEAEIEVFEAWFGDLFDELFSTRH